LTSITANTGATVRGQLFARNGAVTLDNNTISNGTGDNTKEPSGYHVDKHDCGEDKH